MISAGESSIMKGASYNQTRQEQSYPSHLEDTLEQDNYQVLVRKADLDDIEELMKLINGDTREAQDILYDYPRLVTLFERSYLSVTMLDANQKIIGCAVFNDYPQGLTGKIDFQHENFWEYWIFNAFDFDEEIYASTYNTLWLTYLFIAKDAMKFQNKEELVVVEKVFQNVYSTLPHIEGILFLKRGEAQDNPLTDREIKDTLDSFFVFIPVKNREILKKVRGVHSLSDLYYSPKNACTEVMEIRMAREQDHDDLAEIFNRQSEVLTNQFGEFFIADLIATQNLTRRLSKKFKADGKAIVGQVKDRAVGLMSVSTEIDYKLLAQCFELETYDNLFNPEFMDAIRNRREVIRLQQQYKELDQKKEQLKRLEEETMKCHFIGQRMTLQQHCVENYIAIKTQIDDILEGGEEKQKELTKEKVEQMIDSWMAGFKTHQPSEIFYQFQDYEPDIQCMILSPRELLLETLEFFGLQKDYMDGAGHWKNWVQQKQKERREAALRKPTKKAPKKTRRKKEEEKEKDEFALPSYFDLQPFKDAFEKFKSVDAEERSKFRQMVETHIQQVIMLFCNENGEIINERSVDLNEFGQILKTNIKDIELSEAVSENMANFLKCFGDVQYDEEVIMVAPKEDEASKQHGKQNIPLKKGALNPEEVQKPVPKILKKANNFDFLAAINKYKKFDQMMRKLGYIKSKTLDQEVKVILEDQQAAREKELAQRNKVMKNNKFDSIVQSITTLDQIPDVPAEAQNAIVINLFCIDENYESRSLDFVEYAFSLFPEREYIILSQPYTVAETTLLQNFIQIPMKKNSTFDHVLYIFHKDALQSNSIFVRKSKIEDIQDAMPLFQDLLNQKMVIDDCTEAIKHSASNKDAFSIFCDSQLIGMYVVSKTVNLDYYISHFCVQDHIILKEHSNEYHTKLLHSVLNPLFTKSTRFIMKEILRLLGKTVLYFEVHERTLLPDIFNELVFVRARTFPHFLKRKWDFENEIESFERAGDKTEILDGGRDAFDQEEAPFSLSMITKKMLSSVKISNNTRIVVVGASDTGISFIESLLTLKEINFTHITLLAPGGLTTMHINSPKDQLKAMSTNYTIEELKNLMLDARVSVLDAKMVKLEKKNKRIKLDKNAYLPYDILVVAVGLIDTILQNKKLYSAGLSESHFYEQQLQKEDNKYKIIKGVYSIDDPYLYEHFKKTGIKDSNIDLLTRKKKPSNITVYGRTLHTISFISGLINRGVAPERINYVIPPRQHEKKLNFANNKEKMEYEDKCINDPDPFEDERAEKKVFDLLKKIGIHIHKGYDLHEIVTDSTQKICDRIIIRKQADNYQEIQQLIEAKKQEIKERDENSDNQSKAFETNNQEDENDENNIQISLEQEIEELNKKLFDDIKLDSRMLVTSGLVDIDYEIFFIIHENGLVYNGRLIVQSNFQTSTEPQVFCCGKICEFSQRYKHNSIGRSLRLDKYNGRELGQKLSRSILEYLDLSYLTDQAYNQDNLPLLYMPIGLGAYLPNNLYYYHIKKHDWGRPKKTFEIKNNREPLISDNMENFQGNYLCFNFDNNGLIDSTTYLGSEAVSVQSLISFVGLSGKYLNKLDTRFKNGLIPNISEFLSENWGMALYQEWQINFNFTLSRFSEFRHLTKSDILQSENIQKILEKASEYARDGNFLDEKFYQEIKKQMAPEIVKAIQEGTLDFIRENQNHLPMYYIPDKKFNVDDNKDFQNI